MTTTVLLIADASDSAAPAWPATAAAIADLLAALPAGSVAGVALLGTNLMWQPADWRADMPLPAEAAWAGSFVAPVMDGLTARRLAPDWAVIAGAGEVFDLPDWPGRGPQWALLRTGDAPLQAAGDATRRAAEFPYPAGLAALVSRVTGPAPAAVPAFERQLTGGVRHKWALDALGWPMVLVPSLNAYVHLFPVTKPQFEAFLADSPDRRDRWYAAALALNGRVSPWVATAANYEGALMTGLLPEDAEAFAATVGLRIPTVSEWRTAYAWLAKEDVSCPPANVEYALAPAARQMWHALLAARQPKTLLDLSLMREGALEWVREGGGYVALGKPRDSFDPNFRDPLADPPWQPTQPFRRSKRFGLRLLAAQG